MEQVYNFDPNQHVIKLKSKQGEQDYLPVQWRLVWYRSACPEGTITTELIHLDLDKECSVETFVWNAEKRRSEKVLKTAKGIAIFKATITDGRGGSATGTGSECAADFNDYVEKAETKSIGRALAALGYGTQFAPELNEQHRIVDAPVNSGHNGANNGNGNAPSGNNGSRPAPENEAETNATEQQISSIRKLCTHLGKSEPENLAGVSFLGAKKLIQQLTAEYKETRQQRPAS